MRGERGKERREDERKRMRMSLVERRGEDGKGEGKRPGVRRTNRRGRGREEERRMDTTREGGRRRRGAEKKEDGSLKVNVIEGDTNNKGRPTLFHPMLSMEAASQ